MNELSENARQSIAHLFPGHLRFISQLCLVPGPEPASSSGLGMRLVNMQSSMYHIPQLAHSGTA